MSVVRSMPVRRIVRRACCLIAGAVAVQYLASWACAWSAMLADPPTGAKRAAWVGDLSRHGLSEMGATGPGSRSVYRATRRRGVLARSTSIQWSVSSYLVQEESPFTPPPKPGTLALFEAIEPRYRDEFRRWADDLHPIPLAPMAILEKNSFGFPLQGLGFSMRTDYAKELEAGAPSFVPRFEIRGGVNASAVTAYRTPRPALVLPLTPRWPEFLVDAAFWGGALWLMFGGTVMLRGAWRRRWGRCGRCGYDRRGLAPGSRCPECANIPHDPT